jgi:predicted Holliday junction resolvase-like endonuclease
MIIVIVFAVIIIALAILLNFQQQNFQEHIENLTEQWHLERSELLDRIQAPSFAEYKQAEIKMVKAQKDEEPKPSFILE